MTELGLIRVSFARCGLGRPEKARSTFAWCAPMLADQVVEPHEKSLSLHLVGIRQCNRGLYPHAAVRESHHHHAGGVRKAEERDGRPIGRVKRRSELFLHASRIMCLSPHVIFGSTPPVRGAHYLLPHPAIRPGLRNNKPRQKEIVSITSKSPSRRSLARNSS